MYAAPPPLLSVLSPMSAVSPSADSETLLPKFATPGSLGPCCVQTPPEPVTAHAAPWTLSPSPPVIGVLPSAESATLRPKCGLPELPSLGTSFGPCWVHAPLERVNTYAAPGWPSLRAPMSPVLPSDERATLPPNSVPPVSLGPCCVQV